MIKFFTPSHIQTVHEKQKTSALIWFMLTLFVLLFVLFVQSFIPVTNFSTSDYFLPIAQIFVISVLFVLKKHGLKLAGQVFSIGGLLIITIVINIIDQDTVITKYGEEYYLAVLVLVFISLFGTRKLLLISSAVIFISTLRVYFHMISIMPEQVDLWREAQVFFSASLITITLILFFSTKFADEALENAQRMLKLKKSKIRRSLLLKKK